MTESTRSGPGVSMRLRREAQRVASQHRQLDEFQGVVTDALARGDLVEAQRSLARFSEALDAHFSLEEEFYFPALHSHSSELRAELAELALEHDSLRAGFSDATVALASRDHAATAAALEAWFPRLDAHERREEALLGGLP
ncbi:MAG TPA: hemerythrin domain-containing protein [Myxococcota bacterium]|nr:hemerythrin domain-containing protein [Myxococcota bacterium]